MEKLNNVRAVVRLPPGFRFHPTDEELVVEYLKRKAFSFPLPASIIPEFDVSTSAPWDLPGDGEQERYFFSSKQTKFTTRTNRQTTSGCGYWKSTGIDKKIVTCKTNHVVGMKKTLVFYRGKPSNPFKTDWIMHEYRLLPSQLTCQKSIGTQMDSWVICRIFCKKKRGTKDDDDDDNKMGVFNDFMGKGRIGNGTNVASCSSPSSSSSGSSGITEVSSSDNEENSTSCNSFPYFRKKQ